MNEAPDVDASALPIGLSPRTSGESVGLVCNEFWGGNRIFYGPIELPGIRGVLFSNRAAATGTDAEPHFRIFIPQTGTPV